MEKLNCNVIVCGPAIGKTYLASIDSRFIDLDEIKSNYKYGLNSLTREEKEENKLNRREIVNYDSTRYAIRILEEEIRNGKIIMLSYSDGIIQYLIDNKIDYCLIYANQKLADEYAKRMTKRGNNSEFVEAMTNKNAWETFYQNNSNDIYATYKIELKKEQYLSDIKEIFFN